MKKYETYEDLNREDALELIRSGDANLIEKAFISLAYHDEDPDWVAELFFRYAEDPIAVVRAHALHGLFLVSRIRGALHSDRALDVATRQLEGNDETLFETADALVAEVLGSNRSLALRPLGEIERALRSPSRLERLIAVAELFRRDEPHTEISAIGKKAAAHEDAHVRARCLVEVRGFVITDNDQLDAAYANELIEFLKADPSAYVRWMVADFRGWCRSFEKTRT